MTFQISPCIHVAWPSVPSHPCEMTFEKYIRENLADIHHLALGHQRGNIYLDISHVRCMRDDFSNLTSCPSCMAKCPLYYTKVLTWDDFSNLTSRPSCMAKCALHHTKVLTQDARQMTFQISSCIHLAWPSVPSTTRKVTSHKYFPPCVTILILRPPCMSPPHETNIFHLAWKNSQKSHAATPIPSIRYLLRAYLEHCKQSGFTWKTASHCLHRVHTQYLTVKRSL